MVERLQIWFKLLNVLENLLFFFSFRKPFVIWFFPKSPFLSHLISSGNLVSLSEQKVFAWPFFFFFLINYYRKIYLWNNTEEKDIRWPFLLLGVSGAKHIAKLLNIYRSFRFSPFVLSYYLLWYWRLNYFLSFSAWRCLSFLSFILNFVVTLSVHLTLSL